ncbi:zygote arrest protein 1 isoform X1 [Taeniopygia guttata]|uniref:zygote arrest protein 1 isoform X1 n=1 Tax=Taeniopygia guttata TaxID=59729 RepID=UPI003BB989A8
MAEEAMASYLYTTYHPYSYRYPPPKGKGGAAGGWRPRGSSGSSYFSGYGEAAAEYFDNYQRAQLKAILSQVNPNLTPRLRKANTKEVGVQVNPRQDASVQCSLGPRTLLRRRPGPAAPRPREAEREQELGSPATTSTRAVRFPRTIAVYSPVASRRLTAFLEEPSPEPEGRPQQQEKAAAVEEEPAALREQRAAEAAAVRASWEKPPEGGAEPLGQRSAEPLEQRSAAPAEPATEARQEEPAEPSAQPAEPPASPQKQQPSAGKTRLRFQVSVGRRGAAGPGWPGRRRHRRVTLSPAVPGAEVRLLPLQGLQHPLGERLRLVRPGHQQGLFPSVLPDLPEVLQPVPRGGHHLPELQADAVHLPREDAARGSQEATPPGPLWEMQRETPLLR